VAVERGEAVRVVTEVVDDFCGWFFWTEEDVVGRDDCWNWGNGLVCGLV